MKKKWKFGLGYVEEKERKGKTKRSRKVKKILYESMYEKINHVPNNLVQKKGLEKLREHNKNYHCAVISSFSGVFNDKDREVYNTKRKFHNKVQAELEYHSFCTVAIKGTWKDDRDGLHKEEGFFIVVNRYLTHNNKTVEYSLDEIEDILSKIGQKYEQDTIAILPQHTLDGIERAYLVDIESKDKEFFKIDQEEFFISEIFSKIRKRSLTEQEKWILSSVDFKRNGFSHQGRLARISLPLEKTPVQLEGFSVKEWLEEMDGDLYNSRKLRKNRRLLSRI